MYTLKDELTATLQEIRDAGLYKTERRLTTPQSAHVATAAGPEPAPDHPAGRSSSTVSPPPGRGRRCNRPPMRKAASSTMARPSPLPEGPPCAPR